MTIKYEHEISHIKVHHKGDYFLTVCPDESKKSEKIMVHCLSKASSQKPFAKAKGVLEKAYFHPSKPLLVIMTRRSVFVYNLQRQMIHRKMVSGADWNSCLAIHPYGDILAIGSFDSKINFFDMELSEKPFKTLRVEEKTIRGVCFHSGYPLFAACCDDGTVHLLHVRVARDSADPPTIVPLKILRAGHSVVKGLGVLDIRFHPRQPWVFSSGADHRVCLWT
jgi:ribosome biogenesis protein ERB1